MTGPRVSDTIVWVNGRAATVVADSNAGIFGSSGCCLVCLVGEAFRTGFASIEGWARIGNAEEGEDGERLEEHHFRIRGVAKLLVF